MPCTGACNHGTVHINKHTGEEGDDVWASDDENVSAYADRQRAQVNQGYLDGIANAQELGLQKGFDDGYPEGASLGIRVGSILARLHGTSLFEQARRELSIAKVLDRQYYDDKLDIAGSNHPLVAQWEQKAAEINTDH